MDGEVCRLTSYCTRNRGEEIAEVIAAYVTMPQAFDSIGGRPQDRACQKAMEFMKETFGESDFDTTCDHRKTSYRTPFIPTDPLTPLFPSPELNLPASVPRESSTPSVAF